MPLQEIYYIAELVVSVAVIISIVFVAIELRQNTYITRNAMAVQARQRTYWLHQTLCTNNDFRAFHRRIDTDWDNFNEDDKYRASALAVTGLRSMLDELIAYYDGLISDSEFLNLQWNLELAAKRPNFASAYEFVKDGYPTIYGFVILKIGYFLSTSLFLIASYYFLGERRWVWMFVLSFPFVALFMFLLQGILNIYLRDPFLQMLGIIG